MLLPFQEANDFYCSSVWSIGNDFLKTRSLLVSNEILPRSHPPPGARLPRRDQRAFKTHDQVSETPRSPGIRTHSVLPSIMGQSPLSALLVLLVATNVVTSTVASLIPRVDTSRLWNARSIDSRQTTTANEPLRNFEVDAPVYVPSDTKCVQTLVSYSFGNSYGAPYVGTRRNSRRGGMHQY